MSTGHARVPQHISTTFKPGPYLLKLKDQQQLKILFSGVSGPKAYFYSVETEAAKTAAV